MIPSAFSEEKTFSGSLLTDLTPAVNPPKACGQNVGEKQKPSGHRLFLCINNLFWWAFFLRILLHSETNRVVTLPCIFGTPPTNCGRLAVFYSAWNYCDRHKNILWHLYQSIFCKKPPFSKSPFLIFSTLPNLVPCGLKPKNTGDRWSQWQQAIRLGGWS